LRSRSVGTKYCRPILKRNLCSPLCFMNQIRVQTILLWFRSVLNGGFFPCKTQFLVLRNTGLGPHRTPSQIIPPPPPDRSSSLFKLDPPLGPPPIGGFCPGEVYSTLYLFLCTHSRVLPLVSTNLSQTLKPALKTLPVLVRFPTQRCLALPNNRQRSERLNK